jgi:sugar (pentulose or hexulose) kinase
MKPDCYVGIDAGTTYTRLRLQSDLLHLQDPLDAGGARDRRRRVVAPALLLPRLPVLAGGDPVAGDGPRGISLMNVPLDATPSSVTHSAYAYLATVARMLVEELGAHVDPGAILVTSGAAAANPLYMRYRATIIGRPLHILTTNELGGLGAALCAARGRGDEATVEAFAARQLPTLVEPDDALIPGLRRQSDALLELYQGLPGRSLLESLA